VATGCAYNGDSMPTDRASFMQVLTDAGYRTHGIGKMHFRPDSFALRGFQTREHQEELRGEIAGDDYLAFLRAEGFEHVHDPFGVRGEMYYVPQPAQMPARVHGTQWVGDRAVEFLSGEDLSQPTMLMASFIHPHPPFSPPTPWHKLYRGPLMPLPKRPHQCEAFHTYVNRRQNRYKYRDNGIDHNLVRMMKAYYYACISFVDFQVGRMLDVLEQAGQLDRTLILYTSDHGEMLGDYNCFGKRSMLDAAARVPLVVRFPQRFTPGTTCDAPSSLVDVMPTFLGAADVRDHACDLHGADLADVARGDYDERTVYSQYQHRELGVHMALDREQKCFYSAPDRQEYLLHRIEDPDETRNRAGVVFCRDALDGMRSRLVDFYRRHGATDHLDGDGWRVYPKPDEPTDPDAGLLVQDPYWSVPMQKIPGYND